MNAIAGWFVMTGLIVLGTYIENSVEKFVTHKCEAAHGIKEKNK